jgi:hypothetical protein
MGGRSGFGGWMSDTGMGGRGVAGTVTAVAPDHYVVKTEDGPIYTVHFSANTQILKQAVQRQGSGGGGERGHRDQSPPQIIKSTDIKVGDTVAAMGEVDSTARSVGAVTVVLVDPERARQMREMAANYGKTWLMGKVTAVDGVKVTLQGRDNATHVIQADENTTFRKHREPVTLADVQVGDMVRAEGALKGETFVATSVLVMGMPPGGTPTVPRDAQPASAPRQ